MIKKLLGRYCPVLVICLVFIGCTSVPHVDRWKKIEEGKYGVVVDRDYLSDPSETDYAFNSFARDIGADTYSVDKYGPNDFYVTTPGDRQVEDLREVKHFHAGRTVGVIVPPVSVGILLILLFVL
jgi:hypothetical protein